VYYDLNIAGWMPATTANHWTNWSANFNLLPGTKPGHQPLAQSGLFLCRWQLDAECDDARQWQPPLADHHQAGATGRLAGHLYQSHRRKLAVHGHEHSSIAVTILPHYDAVNRAGFGLAGTAFAPGFRGSGV